MKILFCQFFPMNAVINRFLKFVQKDCGRLKVWSCGGPEDNGCVRKCLFDRLAKPLLTRVGEM